MQYILFYKSLKVLCLLGKYNEHVDCVILLNTTTFRTKEKSQQICLKNKMRQEILYFKISCIISFVKELRPFLCFV